MSSAPLRMKYYTVYVLALDDGSGRTYIGSTNDMHRRLRQHNGELAGGARATTRRAAWARWAPVLLLEGFEDQRAALQAEWRLKHVRNRRNRLYPDLRGAGGKVRGLNELLAGLPPGAPWTASSPGNLPVAGCGGAAGLVCRVGAAHRGLLEEAVLARHGVRLEGLAAPRPPTTIIHGTE